MDSLPQPHSRRKFRHFLPITTRWIDSDVYAQVTNAAYYSYFDTVVNEYLVRNGVLNYEQGDVIGQVVETHCNFFSPIVFPDTVQAGLRVGRIGTSSVHYEIGIFSGDQDLASAQGHLLHLYVARADRRPVPLPALLREALERIAG